MDSIHRICSVKDCDKKTTARGYCTKHYKRLMAYGDPLKVMQRQESHGLTDTPVYRSWTHMRDRCYRVTDKAYARYGGRGIRVCERWRLSFVDYYKDMGDKPTPAHSIDRKNGNAHYSCGKCRECIANGWTSNCRWATKSVQNWNKTSLRSDNTSGYVGIWYEDNCWKAGIQHTNEDGIRMSINLGRYKSPEEAAIAYDIACIFFRGDEAKTNIL